MLRKLVSSLIDALLEPLFGPNFIGFSRLSNCVAPKMLDQLETLQASAVGRLVARLGQSEVKLDRVCSAGERVASRKHLSLALDRKLASQREQLRFRFFLLAISAGDLLNLFVEAAFEAHVALRAEKDHAGCVGSLNKAQRRACNL